MPTKRTLREWFAYLDDDKHPITLDEFVAVMAFNEREYVRLLVEMVRNVQNSAEATQATLGALDVFAQRLAATSELPYPSSHDERAALLAASRNGR